MRKLRARGIPDAILLVIQSWRYERKANVNTQHGVPGRVFGPPLWNIYYADAALAVQLHAFLEIVFAETLNYFKDFGLSIANSELHLEMRQCQ